MSCGNVLLYSCYIAKLKFISYPSVMSFDLMLVISVELDRLSVKCCSHRRSQQLTGNHGLISAAENANADYQSVIDIVLYCVTASFIGTSYILSSAIILRGHLSMTNTQSCIHLVFYHVCREGAHNLQPLNTYYINICPINP